MTEVADMIDTMLRELERALSLGMTREEARLAAEVAVRTEYAGERVYVASLPKQRRAVHMARLEKRTTQEIVAATGLSRQHVWRLRKLGV